MIKKLKIKLETKVCAKCRQALSATSEYFYKNKNGLSSYCKKCEKEISRQYRANNKEKVKEYNKEYNKINKEELKIKQKAYRTINKEKISKYEKQYRETYIVNNKHKILENKKIYYEINKDKLKIKSREYYNQNKDKEEFKFKRLEYIRKYYEENKDKEMLRHSKYNKQNRTKSNIRTQLYRAKKNKLANTLTIEQWEHIKLHFNNRCAYCGKELPLAQEHFIPLSKGGEYTVNNIIPVCKICNSSKNNKDFFEWYPNKQYYSKEREEFILKHLEYKEDNK